ncbi:M14 family metallopeptidase [Eubacteriales bacterium OttesenSCG-928-K08]|nr:M14 family metallopeptidase [Eubacteriales bacterium OttesenSCG-928-K08]
MNTSSVYDHYYGYEETTRMLKEYVAQYPDYINISSLLHTEEGREVWLVALTDTRTGDYSEKPAYCAIGPVHCQEVVGVMTVMHFVDYLLTNKDEPQVAQLLKDYTVYLIPMATPDGTDRVLNTSEIPRSIARKLNDDATYKGIMKKDMDGDGIVRVMRFRDPYGPWKISQEDPRVMILRKPDELEGEFYMVLNEGEFECEDWRDHLYNGPERYPYNMNRNWPYDWLPAVSQKGAGDYPLQADENKAIADFIVSHKNLCFILSFHSSGGVLFYPPATQPQTALNRFDMRVMHAFVGIGTEETGYASRNLYEAFARQGIPLAGPWDDYLLLCRGLFCHAIECWDWEIRAGIDPKWDRPIINRDPKYAHDNELKFLRWVDKNCGTDVFKPWTKFSHPQLGEVEIGGFSQVFVNNPPIPFLKQELEKATRLMARQIRLLPKLEIEQPTCRALRPGVYSVQAVIKNEGYLPTYVSHEAKKLGMDRPVSASLLGVTDYINCSATQVIGNLEGRSSIEADLRDTNYIMAPHEACFKTVAWTVEAPAGTALTLQVKSNCGGCKSTQIILK